MTVHRTAQTHGPKPELNLTHDGHRTVTGQRYKAAATNWMGCLMSASLGRRSVLGATLAALPPLVAIGPVKAWAQEASADPRGTPPRRAVTIAMQMLRPTMEPVAQGPLLSLAYRTQANVFEGLLRIDFLDDMRVKPALAERWQRIDDRAWEFDLRRGVRFHDGTDMSASDVAFSLGPERLTGPDAPGRAARLTFQPTLDHVEVVSDHKVRLITRRADPVFEMRIASWGAQIVSEAAYRRAPNWTEWAITPVGTGPYKVVELRRDTSLLLQAHDSYWGGRPAYETLRYLAVPELASRMNALSAGEVDLITDLTPDQIPSVQGKHGFKVLGGSTTNIAQINIDSRHNPQLADANLRRAMSLALDRKTIVDTLWAGRATIPRGFQQPQFRELYDPKRKPPAFDPGLAKQLIAESSYRGERIAYRTFGTMYPGERSVTQVLVEMWREVGVNVQIEVVENFTQLYKRPGSGLYSYSTALLYPDPLADIWRSYGEDSQVQQIEQSWSNAEFNRLGHVLETSTDTQERRRVFHRMLDIFEWEDPAAIILFQSNLLYGAKANLGWKPYPTYQMDFGPFNPPA